MHCRTAIHTENFFYSFNYAPRAACRKKIKSIRLKACQTSNYCVCLPMLFCFTMPYTYYQCRIPNCVWRTHSRFLFLLCHPTHNTILIIITETKYDKKIMREKLCHSTEKQTYKQTHTLYCNTIVNAKDFPYYLYKYAIKKGKRYLPKKGTLLEYTCTYLSLYTRRKII